MKKVLVLGGTGFVGRHVCEQLNRFGIRATVPTRRMIHGRSIQMLPLVDVIEADVHDPATLQRLLPGHDAVINLVAVLHGNRARFEQVHVALPQKLAQAMQSTGVQRLVHISALGANVEGPSLYQSSKARGEAVLQSAGLALTILRPSVIFGAEDRFLNTFARLQRAFPVLPLAGSRTRFQPVWVGDVAQAVVHCLRQPQTIGHTYECVGPSIYTLAELVRLAGRLSGRQRPIWPLPVALGYFQALLLEWLPGEPLMSTDNLRSMEVDNVASGTLPGLEAIGITAQALEPVAASYLDMAGRADPLLALREQASRR
ncbi:complex I NDUFA9 subunit family protein [Tepidicella xavieri]|jgi:NADH dehydrogenase|uniref:NADH dehydrogenase n=1 Tax=Tepidicella xavieri TaxID=360241 RepID=A0A4R6UJ96_9BURK|nr:complex I NDUFA9 subunit family protein [Tepidicella xavieri]TDQ43274.1 NADH dehydrogenase [Tepidicella xavieri]